MLREEGQSLAQVLLSEPCSSHNGTSDFSTVPVQTDRRRRSVSLMKVCCEEGRKKPGTATGGLTVLSVLTVCMCGAEQGFDTWAQRVRMERRRLPFSFAKVFTSRLIYTKQFSAVLNLCERAIPCHLSFYLCIH